MLQERGLSNPIQDLAQKEARLSEVISKALALVEQRTAESVLSQDAPLKEVVRIGELRRETRIINTTVNNLKKIRDAVSQELEPHLLQMGKNHLQEVRTRKQQLGEMSELLADNYLTRNTVEIHREVFKQLESKPENYPLLKRGVELAKKEQKDEKQQGNQPVVITTF